MQLNLKPDVFRLFLTYSNSFISIIDPDVVSLPRNGGLRMAPGRDTLHDGWLPCCHHHITGRLTEIISQNWGKKGEDAKADGKWTVIQCFSTLLEHTMRFMQNI